MKKSHVAGLSAEDLDDIALQAQTLDEVLGRIREAGASPDLDPSDSEKLRQWCARYSPGDPDAFVDRLAWDGWQAIDVARVLETPAELTEPPPWLATLGAALAEAPEVTEELTTTPDLAETLFPDETPPFAELWLPFSRLASERLEAAAPIQRLSAAALAALERHLLGNLATISELSVYRRFDDYRTGQIGPLGFNLERVSWSKSRRVYHDFLVSMLGEGLPFFFKEYPSLARQLVRLVDTWVQTNSSLLNRLEEDASEIRRFFNHGRPLGRIERIRPGLSDRHRGGQQVASLEFSSGLNLVYKPRSVALAVAFHDLSSWLEGHGLESPPLEARLGRLRQEPDLADSG